MIDIQGSIKPSAIGQDDPALSSNKRKHSDRATHVDMRVVKPANLQPDVI